MKRVSLWTGVIGAFGILLMGASAPKTGAKPNKKQEALIKQGEYLAKIGMCDQCHTPYVFDEKLNMPVPDMKRYLAGHPADAPDPAVEVKGSVDSVAIGPSGTSFKLSFGVVYAANLTPDPDTGLGKWTEEQFINTLRKGLHKGSERPVLPPMPWFAFASYTDADLKAIFAYLRSLPAVKNAVPAPKVPPATIEGFAKKREQVAKAMTH